MCQISEKRQIQTKNDILYGSDEQFVVTYAEYFTKNVNEINLYVV